jgi:hypothetical protein
MNLEANLKLFLDGDSVTRGRCHDLRDSSFDYCFNYFQSFRNSGNLPGLVSNENLQLSCLHLGFYLASWGMLRGSAKLHLKSVHHFVEVIKAIASTEPPVWDIDANNYNDSNIETLLTLANKLREAIGFTSDVLVTKVMLGVFGNVPAFDTFFCRGFEVSTFKAKALRKIGAFYKEKHEVLDNYCVPTLDFFTGNETKLLYTKAKLIDMAFFIEGEKLLAAQPGK